MADSKVLIVSHSSRETDLEYCSREHLNKRYNRNGRLDSLPDFSTLRPASYYEVYSGALSFYKILYQPEFNLKFIGSIKSRKIIQHAAFLKEDIIAVAYENTVEIWKLNSSIYKCNNINRNSLETIRRHESGIMAGIHSVCAFDDTKLLLSASASDSVIILDYYSGKFIDYFRMPGSIYGNNYVLNQNSDLLKHYIPNDYQLTHINSAYPFNNNSKIVVSTLIQGAVGVFDITDSSYREITRGYTGCHGARVNRNSDIYFVDSCAGELIILDDAGNVKSLFSLDTYWLHDAIELDEDIYIFTLADKNSLRIYNIKTREMLMQKDFINSTGYFSGILELLPGWLGNSVKFLSLYTLN